MDLLGDSGSVEGVWTLVSTSTRLDAGGLGGVVAKHVATTQSKLDWMNPDSNIQNPLSRRRTGGSFSSKLGLGTIKN